ncbi:LLM class flavin-dependent oxidoreductase [Actinoplanes sp. NEAU-A12]|uniref:LLM class flavin-dependent oxidoreductase n=1 Tax=Actinoplanes sandaracinus TaxID=3045177 RepID=A0ABT6WWC7_9ACTN|nr:LLM class flavin-dependent oxidoreductase [Actinoplanes sandaracinus]MDI6104041.1 LLM class flavin-dependent oxidoreductase [Actinoplanes sandaracinus]
MTHRLRFGALVTSVAGARRAEELGYDLVAVPDTPDTDTWTLLAWIAGHTERIGLAATGLDVAQREPAVLARAAASLDLLSGGRLDLALTGDHLGEVTAIVRGVLDAGVPGPLRHLGAHHRVPKAQRGPLPAHRIPIWLTGADPDSLRLAGSTADAWVADLALIDAAELAAAYKMIDEAAAEAGREPEEIRRILIIGPGLGPDELLALGADTFLVDAGDPPPLTPWQTLREAPGPAVFRPASVRAKRRPGIDYDAIPASLAGTAVEPGDLDYARVRSTYMRGGSPGLVLRPRTTAEVVDALAVVRAHPGVPFGLRSAGHGVSGRSTNDGGIVISLAAMNTVEILDKSRRLIRVGPGARWMDVARAIGPHGWALSSGDYGGVGVGGLATAGGVGWLARKHGLTIDHLHAVEVVLADGTVVRASAGENTDLFWAVRGAGANFGVVTSFEFEVYEVGDVGFAQLVVAADDPADLLVKWGRAIEAAPRDVSGQLIMGPPRPGQPAFAQLMAVVDNDDPETIIDQLQPIAAVAPLYQQQVTLTPYTAVISNAADGGYHQGAGEPISRSGLIEHLTPAFARAVAELLDSGAVHWFQIRTVGGAVADVPAGETAYAHRDANFSVIVMGADKQRVDAAWAGLQPHFQGLYLSFETGLSSVEDAFPPATLARLRDLKHRYDPDNLFRDNFNIKAATR